MRVLHLISPQSRLELERGLRALLERIPAHRATQAVATLGGEPANRLTRSGVAATRLIGPWPSHLVCVPGLRDLIRRQRIELIHAWDPLAAVAARTAGGSHTPVALSVDDPAVADQLGRWCRSIDTPSALSVVCSSEIVRRRLVERGVQAGQTVVIRPGVDFGLINRVDRSAVRCQLKLHEAGPVLLTPGPASATGGQREVIWATALLQQIWPDIRVLLPGRTREQERMERFVRSFRLPELLICTGHRYPFWELLSCADVCVTGARGDTSTLALSWAMAAGVPVVGPAVHAVTELFADHHNGLLCRSSLPRLLAARIRTLLEDTALARRLAEAARGQAFDVFGLRRFVDQHLRLYDNAVTGESAASGIADSARVT